MNPLFQKLAGSVVRGALIAASAWAVQNGILSDSDAVKYVEAGTLLIVGLGWSFYQKYTSQQKLVTALAAPAGKSEADIERLIASKPAAVPSVTTPKDQPPVRDLPVA